MASKETSEHYIRQPGVLLSGERSTQLDPIKDDQGKLITKGERQIKRWADHFNGLLNRPPPATHSEISKTTIGTELPVDTNPPTKAKVLKAIKLLKFRWEGSRTRRDST